MDISESPIPTSSVKCAVATCSGHAEINIALVQDWEKPDRKLWEEKKKKKKKTEILRMVRGKSPKKREEKIKDCIEVD